MMKKLIYLLMFTLNINAHSAEFNPNLPVWKQFDYLYCKFESQLKCNTTSASCNAITETQYLNHAFILDFKKKKMRYLGFSNLESPITSYTFFRKDNLYPTINNIGLGDMIIQIIYLENKQNKFKTPRFEATKLDFAYIEVKSESEVGSFFSTTSICYAQELN